MMKKVHRLCDLSDDELRRIHHTLSDRFGVGRRGEILEIAFGNAEKAGKLDANRTDAFIFYVTSKRMPRAADDRIAKTEGVRIRRQQTFVLVELATDVILFDPTQPRLTGRPIAHAGSPTRFATAGSVIIWRLGFSGPFHWCVTTAGHHFWDRPNVPENAPQVTVFCGRNERLSGSLIMRSLPKEGVDIALVEVSREDLIDRGLIASSAPTAAKRIRSISDIRRDRLTEGTTHPQSHGIEFSVLRYFYEFKLMPQLGTLFDVLKVRSRVNNAFQSGRSGSLWIIARQAACHQSVGWRTSDPDQTYRDGAGQSLHYAFRWVQSRLADQYQISKSKVQVRLVGHL